MLKHLLILFFFIHCSWITVHAQYATSIEVKNLLKTDTTSIGQKINYPQVKQAEVSMLKITMPPGSSTGWHKHEIPLFAYIIQGTLTVNRKDQDPKTFKAGEAVAEMIDIYHEGVNNGLEDVILIACYLGGDGKVLAIKKAE